MMAVLTVFVFLLALACSLMCLVLVRWLRAMRLASSIPTLPGGWPIIGHSLVFFKDGVALLDILHNVSREVDSIGGIAKMWIGPVPLIVSMDPEETQKLANACLQKPYMYDFGKSWIGDGLVIKPETAFGIELKEDKVIHDGYSDAVKTISNIFMLRFATGWMHFDLLYNWTNLKKTENKTVDILHKASMGVLRKGLLRRKRTTGLASETRFKPFMDLLLEHKDKGWFTEEEVREELDTMIVAGHDTTGTELQFAFMLLSRHSDVQNRAYEEIKNVLGNEDRDITKEDLQKLVYLEAIVKETIRLYPVVSLQIRKVEQDIKLDKHTLPKGALLAIPIWGINRSKHWGEDADVFKPDRWLDPYKLPKSPYSFAAFGLGRRNCIGKTFALMSMKTTLAHVIRRYKLSSNTEPPQLKISVLLKTVTKCCISIDNR